MKGSRDKEKKEEEQKKEKTGSSLAFTGKNAWISL